MLRILQNKKMKTLLVFYYLFNIPLLWQLTNGQQLSPFNIVDLVTFANKHRQSNNILSLKFRINLQRFGLELDRYWHNGFSQLLNTKHGSFPNVSRGCALQIEQFSLSLENHDEWAFRGTCSIRF